MFNAIDQSKRMKELQRIALEDVPKAMLEAVKQIEKYKRDRLPLKAVSFTAGLQIESKDGETMTGQERRFVEVINWAIDRFLQRELGRLPKLIPENN